MERIRRTAAQVEGYFFEVSQDKVRGDWMIALYRGNWLLFCGQLPDLITREETVAMGESLAQLYAVAWETGFRAAFAKVKAFAETEEAG